MRKTGYRNIADSIRREMADGRYRAGGMLPPVVELCKRSGSARLSEKGEVLASVASDPARGTDAIAVSRVSWKVE